MCLIIASQPQTTIIAPDLETIQDAMFANADGVGIAHADNGKLRIWRSMKPTPSEVYLRLADLTAAKKSWVAHFRLATHGETDLANCHPVQLGEHAAMVHNGIISTYGTKTMSDTRDFARTWIQGLAPDAYHAPELHDSIEKLSGAGNKFAILTADGRISIVRQSQGEACPETGLWFSNRNYLWGTTDASYYYEAYDCAVRTTHRSKSTGISRWSNGEAIEMVMAECSACAEVQLVDARRIYDCRKCNATQWSGSDDGPSYRAFSPPSSYQDYERDGGPARRVMEPKGNIIKCASCWIDIDLLNTEDNCPYCGHPIDESINTEMMNGIAEYDHDPDTVINTQPTIAEITREVIKEQDAKRKALASLAAKGITLPVSMAPAINLTPGNRAYEALMTGRTVANGS